MAASFSCDGCGAMVVKPKRVGVIVPRDYCDTCADKANAFLSEEEKVRVAVSTLFIGKRAQLLEQYGASGFKLPDVP